MVVGLPKSRCERCGREMTPQQTAPTNPEVCMACFDWSGPRGGELPTSPRRKPTDAERKEHERSVDVRFSGDRDDD
ncbi:hypothetical protein HMI51_16600 [Corallococcus coralloides]|nr:hypothetical protein [Corallococcus coralloides]